MKFTFLIATLSLTFFTYSQSPVTLSGKITHPNNENVFVYQYQEKEGKTKKEQISTSIVAQDGTFKMTFEVDQITELIFNDGNESTTFLIGPGDDLFLTLNTKMFDETIEYYGKGAEKNNAVKNMALMIEEITNLIYESTIDADTGEVFTYIDYELNNLIGLVKDYQSIEGFKDYGERLILDLEESKTTLRNAFTENLEMMQRFEKLIGGNGIDISGVDLKGNPISLKKFAGKIIVIDFWAPWCAPCRAEMPAFKDLEKKYGNKVAFISLGVFAKEKEWKKMATDLAFENNIFVAEGNYQQFDAWLVNYIPRYVVLNADFKIVNANAPRPSSGELETIIRELLK